MTIHYNLLSIIPEIMIFALVIFLTYHPPSPSAEECYRVEHVKYYRVMLIEL